MEGFYMNNKNILLAAAVLVAGQTYGAQPVNDLTTVAGVRAHVTGQRVQAENDAVQALQNAELERRNNLTTFSRVAEDIVINPITACGSMLYGGIKNIGFYSYHFLKYPLVSLGLVAAGRSVGEVLNKEMTDETFKKLLLGGAAAGAIFAIYQAPKDIAKVQEFKNLQKNNSNLEIDFNAAAQLAAAYANTHGSLQVIQQQIAGQTAALQGLQGEQERTVNAIKVAAQKLNDINGQLNEVNGQLRVGLNRLAGIEGQSLLLLEGQFVAALHGLLTSATSLHNNCMTIDRLPQHDDSRKISIQMFAQSLTALNGLANQAMRTIQDLKIQYPDLYGKLQQREIDSITVPLTQSLSLLNQSGKKYLALDQAPVMQKALENRIKREEDQLSQLTSSSSSTTTNTVPNVPIVSEELALRETQSPSLNMNSDSRLSLLAPRRSTLPVHCPSLMNSNNLLPLPVSSSSTSPLKLLSNIGDID